MQEDVNTPTENQVNGENGQNMSKTQDEQRADAGQRPALYGRKVLSFVRRSARLDARLQRAWDAYADTYLLKSTRARGLLMCEAIWCSIGRISRMCGAMSIL